MKYKVANPEFSKLRALIENKKVSESVLFDALDRVLDDQVDKMSFEDIIKGKKSIPEAGLNVLVSLLGEEVRDIFKNE